MTHVSEDELVLLHYEEDAGPAPLAHLESCPECRERLREVTETLALARAPETPEPPDGFEARVWARLRPRLAERESRVLAFRRRSWPRVAAAAAVAASLVLAFLLGRHFPGAPPSSALSPEVRERVLLVAVGDHLERSQMVLLELAHAPRGEPMDVSVQRALAGELVSASRLYRLTAARTDEPAVAAVLEELERVLVEVAAGPSSLAPDDLAELQRRIEARGLLFKVRVLESRVRQRERHSIPTSVSS